MTTSLLTTTFYGQWLPGDPRGSVTNTRPHPSASSSSSSVPRREHDSPGTAYDGPMPGLHRAAAEQLQGPPVSVALPHAEALLEQFLETAAYRGYRLLAVSVMFNHLHLVIEAPPTVGKPVLLRDVKSYGSRRLNRQFGHRSAGWWSDGGSCRPVKDIPAAIYYVCHRQANPLLVWSLARGRIPPSESHSENRWHAPPSPG
jgi:REP element-mobilizing transposase RayT